MKNKPSDRQLNSLCSWGELCSYVTPFLLRDRFNLAIKSTSKLLRVLPSFEAASKILHKKKCSSLSARCLAGSDLLSVELCSDERSSKLRMVSPM